MYAPGYYAASPIGYIPPPPLRWGIHVPENPRPSGYLGYYAPYMDCRALGIYQDPHRVSEALLKSQAMAARPSVGWARAIFPAVPCHVPPPMGPGGYLAWRESQWSSRVWVKEERARCDEDRPVPAVHVPAPAVPKMRRPGPRHHYGPPPMITQAHGPRQRNVQVRLVGDRYAKAAPAMPRCGYGNWSR